MHEQVLEQKTKRLFDRIGDTGFIKGFYLAGGTALALHIGHRKSIDLDLFSEKPFSVRDIIEQLKTIGKIRINEKKRDTLNCVLDGVNQASS